MTKLLMAYFTLFSLSVFAGDLKFHCKGADIDGSQVEITNSSRSGYVTISHLGENYNVALITSTKEDLVSLSEGLEVRMISSENEEYHKKAYIWMDVEDEQALVELNEFNSNNQLVREVIKEANLVCGFAYI